MSLFFLQRVGAFIGVGAFNTFGYFVVSNALVALLNFGVTAAGYLAYAVMVPFSFVGHRKITFRSSGGISAEWSRFCVSQVVNLIVIWAATLVVAALQLPSWIAFAAISVLIPAVSFLMLQMWVFKGTDRDMRP